MQRTEVIDLPDLIELLRKAVLGIERPGSESERFGDHRVGYVVPIELTHSRARLNRDRRRREREIVNGDLDR